MHKLELTFGAGFNNTITAVEIDGKKIGEHKLTTDYSTGISYISNYYLESKPSILRIYTIPNQSSNSIALDMREDTFIHVTLTPQNVLNLNLISKQQASSRRYF